MIWIKAFQGLAGSQRLSGTYTQKCHTGAGPCPHSVSYEIMVLCQGQLIFNVLCPASRTQRRGKFIAPAEAGDQRS